MAANELDLAQLFTAVAQNLAENKDALNQADDYNHDHGDHIVDIFKNVSRTVKRYPDSSPAEQLAKASANVRRTQKSGSGQFYADTLKKASKQMQGRDLDQGSLMDLVGTLLGSTPQQPTTRKQAPQAQSAGGFGDLLQTLMGGAQEQPAPSQQSAGGDLLGELLSGMTGQSKSSQAAGDGKLDLNDLLSAGMSFMNAKSRGASNTEAAIQALMSSSPLGQYSSRSQSGNIIASTLLDQVLKGMSR